MFAIRGAITCNNTKDDVTQAALKLIHEVLSYNKVEVKDVVAIIFSATDDLTEQNPAAALRTEVQFEKVAMFCVAEMKIQGGLPNCLRVLVLANGEKSDVQHRYLKGAHALRPDLDDFDVRR